jgi:predicted amidophosphoribosyltransferase
MGRADFYKDGDYNGICDSCGKKFKFSTLKQTWQGFFVCKKCYEPRHPQDFVRAVKDKQQVPNVRGDVPPTFRP